MREGAWTEASCMY